MNDIFESNLAALKDKAPHIFERLQKEIEKFRASPQGDDHETFRWIETAGFKNLHYENPSRQICGLYHSEDPVQEAEECIRQMGTEYRTCVIILGIGLGYLPKIFYDRKPDRACSILILEKNPQIFLRALCVHDFKELFDDSDVYLEVEENSASARSHLENFFMITNTVSRFLRVTGTPFAFSSEDEYYTDVAEHILMARDLSTLYVGNTIQDAYVGLKNTVDNIDFLIKNPGIAGLKDKFQGKTVISLAAGPQINEHWDMLKKIQGKVPIIACDTLLKPLMDRGIIPDFVTAIEKSAIVTNFFKGIEVDPRSFLIATSYMYRESFDAFQGDSGVYPIGGSYVSAMGIDFLAQFWGGPSSGNLNIKLAAYMGFSTIIMVGHNLAYGYKTNETHARGTIDPSREQSRTPDQLQAETKGLQIITQDETDNVWTRTEWVMFRLNIENSIACNPDKKFINTAAKGAFIRGAVLMDFEKAVETFINQDFDIYPLRKQYVELPTPAQVKERVEHVLEATRTSLEVVKKWYEQGHEIYEKLQKWKDDIELKEKLGKFVSLNFLDKALDEVLELKVRAINDDKAFHMSALNIIYPGHMTMEREFNEMPGKYKDNYTLKRDFLLRHIDYFGLWERWFPKIIDSLALGIQKVERDFTPASPSQSDSPTKVAHSSL